MNARPSLRSFLVGASLVALATPALADSELPPYPNAQPAAAAEVQEAPAPPPPPANVVVGPWDSYRPLATWSPKGILIQLRLLLNGRMESVTDIPVDRYGTTFETGIALSPQLRIGALIDTLQAIKRVRLVFEYESDSPTGYWTSGTPIDGDGYPNSGGITGYQLRKASARLSVGRYFHIGGGFTLNHWGLGLLANDGAHGWEPGNAQFIDPRNGDRVLRAYVATGPLTRANLQALLAFDQVRGDDILLNGDRAWQVLAVLQAGFGKPSGGGIFFVHRRLKTIEEKEINASVVDLAGRTEFGVAKGVRLKLEGEIALIAGQTTLAPTPDHPEHLIIQVGAAARATVDAGRLGTVWDFFLASGDQNLDDSRSSSFKIDPNYPTGLLLFRYVTAAQSARSPVTAADPNLVGYPAQDLGRIPTRGSATNTVAFYPRLWARPFAGFEVYGGVLFAWSMVQNTDPFNTRLAGGSPRNVLNGDPGKFYGAEIDLGVRYRVIFYGTQLTIGAEGGALVPGSAFNDATGSTMDNVLGGRLMLEYRL